MRLSSLVGPLVMALAAGLVAGACQVRNPQRCQLPDFPCERGIVCKLDPGSSLGTCAEECNSATAGILTTCPDERPICGDDGACRTCKADAECQGRSPGLPRCVAQKCAVCRTSTDCSDPLKPVCDASSNTCRGCSLHGECADHVCVKDDTLLALPEPLRPGQCVPASRQVVVDPSCTGGCSAQTRLLELDPSKPYLRLSASRKASLILSKPLNALPVIHIVTDTADFSPAQLTTAPTFEITNGATTALQVNAGVDAVLEGLTVDNSRVGLACSGAAGSPKSTRVRVLRSLFASNRIGISSQSCDLRIEDSWLGIAPPAYGDLAPRGNGQAMDLDTTRFEVVNTVLVRNAPETGVTGFAGIRIRNTQGAAQPGRIINTTFARQDTVDTGGRALAVDCTYAVGTALTLVNSLFLNDAPLGSNTYVAPSCRSANVAYNGSNDPTLTGTGSVTNLKYVEVFTAAAMANDPRVKASALPLVRHGSSSFVDLQGPVIPPARDIEGKPRPSSGVAFGAFEPAP